MDAVDGVKQAVNGGSEAAQSSGPNTANAHNAFA